MPTMTENAAAHAPTMEVDNIHSGTQLNAHNVRFDFPFNDSDAVPKAPKILHMIFRRLVDSVKDIEFRDVHGVVIDLDNFPIDKPSFDYKFNTTVSDTRMRHILVLVEIRCDKKVHELKQLVWESLSQYNVYMKHHTLGLHQVDVCSPGWFSHTNPKFHSRERTKDDIYNKVLSAMEPPDEMTKLVDNFPDYIIDGKFEVPEFQLVHRHIQSSGSRDKVEAEAFEVQIERKHTKVFIKLMELAFANTNIDEMIFIPSSLKHTLSGDKYSNLIHLQRNYLETHRNISIAGIGNLRMEGLSPDYGAANFEDLLKSLPGVYRVDTTKRTPDLGKWNISTDKEHYAALTKWIDEHLVAFFTSVPVVDASEVFADFPIPRRLSRSAPKSTNQSASSLYAQKFETDPILEKTTSSKPSRPAWNRLPVDMEYKNSQSTDFPSLPTKKVSSDTRPIDSTPSPPSTDFVKIIADLTSEFQAKIQELKTEIRQSKVDLNEQIRQSKVDAAAFKASLPQVLADYMEATITQVLNGFKLDMREFYREIVQEHAVPPRKPAAKRKAAPSPESLSSDTVGTQEFDDGACQIVCSDDPTTDADSANNGDKDHARGLSHKLSYESIKTTPRWKQKCV
jgi:hypothetical protein